MASHPVPLVRLVWLRRDSHEGHFVIDVETDSLVGVANLNEIFRRFFKSAWLGYYALQLHARKGFMGEGLRKVIRRDFGELGRHRLEADSQPDIAASIGLVRRLEFRREGCSPRYLKLSGCWRDHERWALLRDHGRGRSWEFRYGR